MNAGNQQKAKSPPQANKAKARTLRTLDAPRVNLFAPPVKTGVEGVVADEEPWPEEPELDPEAELPWVAAAALLAAEVGTRLEPR